MGDKSDLEGGRLTLSGTLISSREKKRRPPILPGEGRGKKAKPSLQNQGRKEDALLHWGKGPMNDSCFLT